jgi:hypothetical protein
MSSNENNNKLTPVRDIYKRMEQLKKIYILVEVKKYSKYPEWIEKMKIAIDTFDKMTWLKGLLNGTVPDVEAHQREEQFLDFLQDIFLCQALFFLPSCPCEHIINVSQHLNVICMHGQRLQLRINILQVESYIDSHLNVLYDRLMLKENRTDQQNGVTRGLLNSRCILRSEIGNLLSRL